MFIYSLKPKLSPSLKEIESVNDVLAVLRAQGFYDMPAVKNNEYTPDINELAKSIYELIQLKNIRPQICKALQLTPKTANQEQILRIFDEFMQLTMQTVPRKQYISLQAHFAVLGAYFDTMISGCEK